MPFQPEIVSNLGNSSDLDEQDHKGSGSGDNVAGSHCFGDETRKSNDQNHSQDHHTLDNQELGQGEFT